MITISKAQLASENTWRTPKRNIKNLKRNERVNIRRIMNVFINLINFYPVLWRYIIINAHMCTSTLYEYPMNLRKNRYQTPTGCLNLSCNHPAETSDAFVSNRLTSKVVPKNQELYWMIVNFRRCINTQRPITGWANNLRNGCWINKLPEIMYEIVFSLYTTCSPTLFWRALGKCSINYEWSVRNRKIVIWILLAIL
mgnify:CR=1 FL=1